MGQCAGHLRPAAHVVIAHGRDAHRADEQQDGLDALGPDHGQQAADHGVDARQHGQHDDEEHQRIEAEDGGRRVHAEDSAEHQCRRVERHADVDHHGREDGNDRQPVAAVAVIAAFEEIRQRGHPAAKVQGGEKQREQHQRESGHPLEIAVDHAVLVGRLGETHEVHGGDVGGEHRQPDHRPAERVAGQEVVAALAARGRENVGRSNPGPRWPPGTPARSPGRSTKTRKNSRHALRVPRFSAFTIHAARSYSIEHRQRRCPRVFPPGCNRGWHRPRSRRRGP